MFTSGNGDRSDVTNIAMIVTDGNSNINEVNTIPFAIDARRKGVHVIVVSIGDMLNMLELKGMASMPVDSNLYAATSWKDLPGLKVDMIDATCDGKQLIIITLIRTWSRPTIKHKQTKVEHPSIYL